MGGNSYDRDVRSDVRSTRREVFQESYAPPRSTSSRTTSKPAMRVIDPLVNPKGRAIICGNQTPILVKMDVSKSRGDDAAIIYNKMAMFVGQMVIQGYAPDPAYAFWAIGDATSGDRAPLQVTDFVVPGQKVLASMNAQAAAKGMMLTDYLLSKIWLEEGGGGTGQESYELGIYFAAEKLRLTGLTGGRKGYCFITGDEGFYSMVAKDQVKTIIGDSLAESIPSADVFAKLQQLFHVFFIFPKKDWKDRKENIDAEIERRVKMAGGQHDNVSIRASLMWETVDDLDLHVIDPSGQHIFYHNKMGLLDVDRNAHYPYTNQPVENIRWRNGTAPAGHYKVFVENYAYHSDREGPIDWKAEIEIGDEILHFNGIISKRGATGTSSRQMIYEFDYDPSATSATQGSDKYSNYQDAVILDQWKTVIPESHILVMKDPNAVIDVMMGAVALCEGTRDLEGYIKDMADRGQTIRRRKETEETLSALSASVGARGVVVEGPAPSSPRRTRPRSTRL